MHILHLKCSHNRHPAKSPGAGTRTLQASPPLWFFFYLFAISHMLKTCLLPLIWHFPLQYFFLGVFFIVFPTRAISQSTAYHLSQ